MILDELLVVLGFDYDPKDITKFKKDLTQTVDVVKKLTRVAVGAAAAITGLTVASIKASDEQGKFAAEIGDSVENIDALQFALESSGGSADAMVDSLRNLAMRSAEAARGVGSGVEAFGILGISVTNSNGELKRSSDLMLEVSDRLQGLDRSRQIELADKLGLTGSIRLLQHGSKEISSLTAEAKALGVTTAEDAKISAEFQNSLTNIFTVVKDLSRTVAREFAPRIKDLADTFSTWWVSNSELIKQDLPGWIDKAVIAMKLLVIATSAWLAMRLATGVLLVAKAFKTLSLSAMLANLAVLGIPGLIVLAIGAAVTAIGLLIDDMRTFFKGGESYVGDLVKKIPMIGDALYAIADAFAYVGRKFITDSENLKDALIDFTYFVADSFEDMVDRIARFFSNLWSFVFDNFRSIVLTPISNALQKLTSPISSAFNKALDFGGDSLSKVKNFFEFSSEPKVNQSIPSGDISTSNVRNNITKVDKLEISVQSAGDPSAVANAVYNIFQQTSQDLNTAVEQ